MRLGRRAFARIAVVGLLAGSLVAVLPAPAHADALKPRKCADPIINGDGVRRLDVCARGWVNTASTATRGVLELHTYARSFNNVWVDSRSQSITVEQAFVDVGGAEPWPQGSWFNVKTWGQYYGGNCRVNGPGGSVGCSVPNTIRVAFYSPQIDAPNVTTYATTVISVSWRDDRGVAHPNVPVKAPDRGAPPLASPVWSA